MKNYQEKEWLQKELERLGSGREIAKVHNLGKTTVANWLKKFELSLPPDYSPKKKKYQQKEWIEEELESGKSLSRIAEESGISVSRMREISSELNIDAWNIKRRNALYKNESWLRKQFEIYGNPTEIGRQTGYDRHSISDYLAHFDISHPKKYLLNSDFFEEINSEKKAYWLGFLMADSTMLDEKSEAKDSEKIYYRLVFKLSLLDVDVLHQFKKDISATYDIKTSQKENSAYIAFRDNKMCGDLVSHGIIPRRTGKKCIPKTVPEELLHHFLRGFFDGDGSIRYEKDKRKGPDSKKIIRGLTIACGGNIHDSIVSIYKSLGVLPPAIKESVYEKWSTVSLYRKDEIPKVVNYLYKDATIYMDRKYQIAKNYMSS